MSEREMTDTETLVQLNIEHLRQGQRMVANLDEHAYLRCDPGVYKSGIGEHVRHILEHYQMFLQGCAGTVIDYDARERDMRISADRKFAIAVIDSIVSNLHKLSASDRDVHVKMSTSHDLDRNTPYSKSTFKRELQYLQAHTIHHFALIAFILRLQGLAPADDFGVAPSTLQYIQATQA